METIGSSTTEHWQSKPAPTQEQLDASLKEELAHYAAPDRFRVQASDVHVYHHQDREPPTTKVTLTRYQKGDYGWSIECRDEDSVTACEMAERADFELRAQYIPNPNIPPASEPQP